MRGPIRAALKMPRAFSCRCFFASPPSGGVHGIFGRFFPRPFEYSSYLHFCRYICARKLFNRRRLPSGRKKWRKKREENKNAVRGCLVAAVGGFTHFRLGWLYFCCSRSCHAVVPFFRTDSIAITFSGVGKSRAFRAIKNGEKKRRKLKCLGWLYCCYAASSRPPGKEGSAVQPPTTPEWMKKKKKMPWVVVLLLPWVVLPIFALTKSRTVLCKLTRVCQPLQNPVHFPSWGRQAFVSHSVSEYQAASSFFPDV